VEIISRDLFWRAERNTAKKPQPGQPDSRPRFDSSTFRLEACRFTAPHVEQRVTGYTTHRDNFKFAAQMVKRNKKGKTIPVTGCGGPLYVICLIVVNRYEVIQDRRRHVKG
jgi:hypothetical protein